MPKKPKKKKPSYRVKGDLGDGKGMLALVRKHEAEKQKRHEQAKNRKIHVVGGGLPGLGKKR